MRETIQDELITLFGYETDRGRNSILWDSPFYFHTPGGQSGKELDQRFSDWMSTKRPIQKEEMLDGVWKKIADHGYTFVVRFLSDGTFIEHNVASSYNLRLHSAASPSLVDAAGSSPGWRRAPDAPCRRCGGSRPGSLRGDRA